MTINRNNFEAYLLDYLEGNLDPLRTADLMVFLAENPEFEQFIPENDRYKLPENNKCYFDKALLKKDFSDISKISDYNFGEFCIAYTEGMLFEKDRERVDRYIANDREKKLMLDMFRKAKVQPDLSITYPDKISLKKPITRGFSLSYISFGLGIAASIALLIILILNRRPQKIEVLSGPVVYSSPQASFEPSGQVEANKKDIAIPEVVNVKQTGVQREITVNDTANTAQQRKLVALSSLKPLESSIPAYNFPHTLVSSALSDSKSAAHYTYINESLLSKLIDKVDFWKTAETAIQGFNLLTESQLAIAKKTDEDGKLEELLLHTESYSISGNRIAQ